MMSKGKARLLLAALALVCCTAIMNAPAAAQGNSHATVITAQHAVSPALRDLKPDTPSGKHDVFDLELIPRQNSANSPLVDQALQTTKGPLVNTTNGLNFEGIAENCGEPSDSNGAIGATQYVEWINCQFEVFDKTTGAHVAGPFNGNTLFTSLGGQCASNNSGDPIAQYDKLANRWVLTQPVFSAPYFQCIAVSQTSDATGAYNVYAFSLGSTDFPDYPKLSVWPDAYYVTYNLFPSGFIGPQICAYDRSKMLAGLPATGQCFNPHNDPNLTSNDGGMLPSDVDGIAPPPVGEPNMVLELDRTAANSNLDMWKFHVDFTIPANSTLTGPFAIPVTPWTYLCGGGGTCVPQKGTTNKLDTLGDRMMYRLPYRNFTGTGGPEIILASHSVASGGVSGERWYEIHDPNGSPTVYQQGTFQPDTTWRWMGSIAMDQNQDIALGYSLSSSSIFPEVGYTGRVPTDPLGTLETENVTFNGTGSETGHSRWGDYEAMSVDPVDDCTFWFIAQYIPVTGDFNWHTRINNFKFNGCGGPPTPNFNVTATPSSQTVTPGGSTSYTATVTPTNGFVGSVTMTVSGLPSGANGTFTPNPVVITSGAQSTTLNVTTSNSTPGGTYTLTITGTSGVLVNSTTVSLVVAAAGQITITPTSLTFAKQVINTTSAAKKITVKNTGSVTVNFTSVVASGDFAISSNTCTGGLSVGATCITMVTFTPTALGARTGSVTYTDDASGSPQSVSLTGTGVLAATLTPVSATFKGAELITTAAKAFTLTNNQSVTLNVSSVAVSANYAETDNCQPTVAPLGHCTINVTFTPPGVGTFNGTLTVTDDAANSPQSSTLSGTGLAQATINKTSLTFGLQTVGTTSAPKQATLKNNLPTPLTFSTVTTGDFAESDTCGGSVPANGGTCILNVTFTPTATGTRTGTLTVNNSSVDTPFVVSLSGTGK